MFTREASGRLRNIAALAAAASLHFCVLSFALSARWIFPARLDRETVTEFVLPRLVPRPQPTAPPPAIAQAPRPFAIPDTHAATSEGPAPVFGWITPPVDSGAVLQELGRSLGCTLGNFEHLSAEEKQRCALRLHDSGAPQVFAFTAHEAALRGEWAAIMEERRVLPPCPIGSANAGVGCTFADQGGLGKAISPVRGFD